MDLGVGPHVSQGLAPVATELAGVGSVGGVAVSHVGGQGGGGGAGHGTGRALVLHHVTPHVVPQQPRGREGLGTGGAGELLVRLLAAQVVEELGPGGEEAAAGGAGHQLLLAVAAHVLPQLGHGGVGPAAAGPPALEGGAQGGGVAAHVPVEVLGRGHQEGEEGGGVPLLTRGRSRASRSAGGRGCQEGEEGGGVPLLTPDVQNQTRLSAYGTLL